MGTDVWSESGIVLTLDAMVGSIPKRGFASVAQAVKQYVEKNVQKYPRLRCLLEPGDRAGFIDAMLEVSSIEHEFDEDDEDYEYDESGHIRNLWDIIIKKAHPDLPKLKEVKVFVNGRECGYNVPIDEPVFIFDQSGLLKQILTDKGKRFKKVFGSCTETDWSVMSY
jgi:hypothetical protein